MGNRQRKIFYTLDKNLRFYVQKSVFLLCVLSFYSFLDLPWTKLIFWPVALGSRRFLQYANILKKTCLTDKALFLLTCTAVLISLFANKSPCKYIFKIKTNGLAFSEPTLSTYFIILLLKKGAWVIKCTLYSTHPLPTFISPVWKNKN